jgi:hypothetical protein
MPLTKAAAQVIKTEDPVIVRMASNSRRPVTTGCLIRWMKPEPDCTGNSISK